MNKDNPFKVVQLNNNGIFWVWEQIKIETFNIISYFLLILLWNRFSTGSGPLATESSR